MSIGMNAHCKLLFFDSSIIHMHLTVLFGRLRFSAGWNAEKGKFRAAHSLIEYSSLRAALVTQTPRVPPLFRLLTDEMGEVLTVVVIGGFRRSRHRYCTGLAAVVV